jgi:acetyltransferase-like isoleucine patch superfamily enzyme
MPFLLKAALRRYLIIIFFRLGLAPTSFMRVIVLRMIGAKVGRGCYVGFDISLDTNYPELISIGDNVTISHSCTMLSHTASPVTSKLSAYYSSVDPIVISNGAWIGANVILLPGTEVGADTFVAAGSVVHGKLDPASLYAGNPAILKKRLAL